MRGLKRSFESMSRRSDNNQRNDIDLNLTASYMHSTPVIGYCGCISHEQSIIISEDINDIIGMGIRIIMVQE